jgi:8-oxo-dGTP pyrophosphatase MutT (NUDIX family)
MIINKIGAAIIKDNKLLIVKEIGWSKYGIPGGKIRENESDLACLGREIKEELDAKIAKAEHIGTFEDAAMNEPDKIIRIKLYRVELASEPKMTSEIHDMRWFGSNDDTSILGPIDKNKIIPALIEKKFII